MNTTFGIRVIASDKVFFDGRASVIVFPSNDGETAFLPHHEDAIIALVPGEMRFKDDKGEWHIAAVSSGFAQIINNRVMVLVLTCERPEDIDAKRAEEAKERAEEQMRQKQSQQEYYTTQAALSRAMTRLRVKDHKIV